MQPIAREILFPNIFKIWSKTWLHTKIQPPSYLESLPGVLDFRGVPSVPGVHNVPCIPGVLSKFTDFLGQFPEFPAQLLLYFGLLPPSTLKFSHCALYIGKNSLNIQGVCLALYILTHALKSTIFAQI